MVPFVLASSICWSLQCLISALTQGGQWWTLFVGSLVQLRCGEGGTLQTNNTGVCSQCLSHTGPDLARGTHSSGSRLLHRELSEAGPGLHAPLRSKPLRFRHSCSPQRHRLGWACVLCPSQVRVAQVFGERGRCDLSPFPSLLFSFLGVQLAPLLRWIVTVQNLKKSKLAKKLTCSLVVNVSLGL